jgi:adenosylmethionine-8-amino-7-oxononanoate aminotransferase
MGVYLTQRLEELRAHPTVGDVRGVGLLQAIELVQSKSKKSKWGKEHPFAKRVSELLMERGFITRTWEVMHFAPPLVVTREEIDRMVTIADEALTIAEKEHAKEIED